MTSLTKEQREHYGMLVKEYGEPPKGATHFDVFDYAQSSWTKRIEDGTCFWWDSYDNEWKICKSRTFINLVKVPKTINESQTKFVCVELDSDEAVVGDLDTILYWQEERNIPARRCIYYTVGEEVDFKDIVKQSRSE